MFTENCDTAIGVRSKSVVLQFHKLQQQTVNDSRYSPALWSHRILTLVSNCGNLHSASPSLEKGGCRHTVKSVFQPTKCSNCFASRVGSQEIRFPQGGTLLKEISTQTQDHTGFLTHTRASFSSIWTSTNYERSVLISHKATMSHIVPSQRPIFTNNASDLLQFIPIRAEADLCVVSMLFWTRSGQKGRQGKEGGTLCKG